MRHTMWSVVFLFLACGLATAEVAKLTAYITGDPNNAAAGLVLGGPGLNFGGGSWDVDTAFQQMIDAARGCSGAACATKVDVVVLRVTGADGYNVYSALNGVDSIVTYVVTTITDANNAALETAIKNAEVIFFAGGDQCDYTKIFKATKVETAVEFAYARGAYIGGTSAGMAILGDVTYDACTGSATSSAALANPYDKTLTYTYNFFNFTGAKNTVTDQHFVTRDRMGRTLVNIVRQIQDSKLVGNVWAVAANEETSFVMDKNGIGTVMANNGACCVAPIPPASNNAAVYFILADKVKGQFTCASRVPLTYLGFKVWKRTTGQTFNMVSRPTTAPDYTIDVNAGVITVNGNNGNIY